jgi:hypothetical protein
MEKTIGTFFAHQIAMKMYHFQTKSFGAHKAADEYLAGFATNFDKLMEVLQGEFGTVEIQKLSLNVSLVTDETVISHLNRVIDFMRQLKVDGEELPSEIVTIRDDMISEAQKLKYLLTFK